MSKAIESKVSDLIASEIETLGYDLVRAHVSGNGKYAKLQIMAERKDGVGMTVDDCATISVAITPLIEADPELAAHFDLEVSSPGIDRPLVKLRDYERYQGHLAKIDLVSVVNGKRKFQGKIVKVSGEDIDFEVDKTPMKVPFKDIDRAKLVLTDELLKKSC
jgi:ribosome maturation factor RimP